MQQQLSQRQALALIGELVSATTLLDLGIGELHGLSLSNDFYDLPLQLLAQGFERFLKLTYAMAEFGQVGTLPSLARMKRYGHDLRSLTDDLVRIVETSKTYIDRPAVRQDLSFIRSDSELRAVLTLLSNYGTRNRYYRFDEFLAPNAVREDEDPYRAWQQIEHEIMVRQPEWAERLGTSGEQPLQETVASLTRLLDRFARAVARMWTLGALPQEAQRYTSIVGRFLYLRDEQLGSPRR